MTPKTPKLQKYAGYRRALSLLISFFLVINQVATHEAYAYNISEQKPASADLGVVSLEEANARSVSGVNVIADTSLESSQQFLENELTLEKSGEEEKENEEKEEINIVRDYDEYNFSEAVEVLNQKDVANAVVVKTLTVDDLKELTKLEVEVGIAVIEHKLVLFTSGSKEEIRVLAPVNDLLAQADLIAHVHPAGDGAVPSQTDIEQASSVEEYVVSEDGIYAYTHEGLINQEAYDYSVLAGKIDGLVDADASSVEARQVLNRFIALIDEYNLNQDESILFRSAGETVFPGHPVLGFFNGGGAPFMNEWLDQPQSSTQFRMDYDVTANGSFQGAVINFGASEEGPQDLSALSKFTFSMRRDPACNGGANCLKIEFKDSANRVAAVYVQGLSTSFLQIDIPKSTLLSSNPNIDFTSIKEIVFVMDRNLAGPTRAGFLEVKTGGVRFVADVNPDASKTVSDVTKIPANSQGNRPVLTAFAKSGDTFTATPTSATQATFDMNLTATDSFGGIFIDYDNLATDDGNPATTTDIETIDVTSVFAGGIVLGLNDAGTGVSEAVLELTDVNGQRDKVRLQGIDSTTRFWSIPLSKFEAAIDMTKIKTIALVVEGQHVNDQLNLIWGDHFYLPAHGPDGSLTIANVTKLPADSLGNRPSLTGFASFNANDQYSSTNVTLTSMTNASLTLNHFNTESFGGVFVNYDNPNTDDGNAATTTDIETINLNTLFASGIVLGLSSTDQGVSQVKFEVTDINGNQDSVLLTGIDNVARFWKVLVSEFDQADTTKIRSIAIVTEGAHVGNNLTVEWGDFAFVPGIDPNAALAAGDIIPVPVDSQGNLPVFTGFASFDAGSDPYSSTDVAMSSKTAGVLTFNHFAANSFGGAFLNYDNPDTDDSNPATTTDIETINVQTLFSTGIVVGLSSPNGVSRIKLELTDINGNKDAVYLNGMTSSEQFWRAPLAAFDQIDLTKIQTIAFVSEGQSVGGQVAFRWGSFAYTPILSSDASVTAGDITPLPKDASNIEPVLTGFTSFNAANDPYSSTAVTLQSKTQALMTFNHFTTASFGGAFLNYDLTTTGTTETIDLAALFAGGIKLGLSSPANGVSQVAFELTDINGNVDSIMLGGITDTEKYWNINVNLFDDVDVTKIKSIALVVNGRHVGHQLAVNWGNFYYVPGINPNAALTAGDITPLPQDSQSNDPTLTGFASFNAANDPYSSTDVVLSSKTSGLMTFNHFTSSSFGGAFVNYDDPNTDDGNAGTTTDIETINLNTLFPGGLTFGLSSPSNAINEVMFEVTDITGKKDSVRITGITDTAQFWNVPAGSFDDVDVTKIQSIAFVVSGIHVGHQLAVNWGNFAFTPQAGPDAGVTAGDITPLPQNSLGVDPTLTGFASFDSVNDPYSSTDLTLSSKTTGLFTFNHFTTASFGGGFVSYDDPATNDGNAATTTDIETINLNTLFASGIKFGLTSPNGGVTTAKLEVTDINGNKDTVRLTGITNTEQFWNIAVSLFDTVDTTKIQTIAIVVEGRLIGQQLSVNWGNFAFVPGVNPDASLTAGDITPVPTDSLGNRPAFTGFASFDAANDPYSSTDVTMASKSGGQLNFNLFTVNSFGGAFLNYDNPATNDNNPATTTDIETIDVTSVFPTGIVLGLDGPGNNINEVKLELTDINGNKSSVRLTGITSTGQLWKVNTALFENVDLTKIQTIALVVEGSHPGHLLNFAWGDFAFIPDVAVDAANPAITKVLADSQGNRPTLTGFASSDGSSSTVTMLSQTLGNIAFALASGSSFGGAFINYDDFSTDDSNPATTADIETINLITAFPTGIVFELNNAGTNVSSVLLEVTDNTGKKDTVRISGITDTNQRWTVNTALFDEVDTTHIQSIAFVETGNQIGTLTVNWGDFAYTPGIGPDATNPAITKLPVTSTGDRPVVTGFAKNDGSTASVNMVSETISDVTFNFTDAASFGGVFINYDDFSTDDGNAATTTDIENINLSTLFPSGMVFGLSNGGTALDQVQLELTDIDGNRDSVTLTGITNVNQRWKVDLSLFDQVDVTKIKTITFVSGGQLVNQKLRIDWGNFYYVPGLAPDAANPALTNVPVNSLGERPVQNGFASTDGSTVQLVTNSVTSSTATFNLANASSFGGVFFTYDDFNTNDGNPATTTDIESIDVTSVFPGGIVFGLNDGGTGLSQVMLELTDVTGKRDSVLLTGIDNTARRWKVDTALFDEIDLTKVSTFAFVATGQLTNKQLNIEWGNFFFVQGIAPDATNPAITNVPANSLGDRPVQNGFASTDGSTAQLVTNSISSSTLTVNLIDATSFGGMFFSYDDFNTDDGNPATTTDIESIDVTSVFPGGIVLGLNDGGTGLSQVKLELTDVTGKRDSVILTGIDNVARRWKINTALFDEIDLTKVSTFAIVTTGPLSNKQLNIEWGNFFFVPGIAPDATNPAITKVPANSQGNRPELIGFASNSGGDTSTSTATMTSTTTGTIDIDLKQATSFGGAFFDYDDFNTGSVESINLDTLFPAGIVLGLNDGGTGLSQVTLELTDANGNKDSVLLTGIDNTARVWKIAVNNFDQIDTTKVRTFALVTTGIQANKKININWGDFLYTPGIAPDGSLAAGDVTPLPVTSTNVRPSLTGFASYDATNDPFSTTDVNVTSVATAEMIFNHFTNDSFGGVFVNYDDPNTDDSNPATTTDIETIDLSALFASGVVFGLSSPNSSLNSVVLEITDINGNRDTVTLTGITNVEQFWKINPSAFDQADPTKVQTISLVTSGVHSDARLNLRWGNFAFTPSVDSDATNPAITSVPANSQGDRPVLTGFASSSDSSSATVTMLSKNLADIDFSLFNSTSFGGVFFDYDDLSTNDNNPATTTDIESINLNTVFPGGIVFELDNQGTGVSFLQLEVTDVNGNKDTVIINGITDTAKRWKVDPALFDEADVTKIKTIALVLTGQNTGKKIRLNWGDFFSIPRVAVDATNPAITKVPADSQGNRPALTAFASNDGSTVTAALNSEALATLNFNLAGAASFGGAFINYDDFSTDDGNPATTSDIETINLAAVFPSGIVLELNDGGTGLPSVFFEITDINGNKDKVLLTGITNTNQRWKIDTALFDEADITKIRSIALVEEGALGGKQLFINWGDFAFTPGVTSDPSNPAITQLPLTSEGIRPVITPFAKADGSASAINLQSTSLAELNLDLNAADSFGGAFIDYDNVSTNDGNPATTTDIESIDLSALFPGGIVFGLSNAGTGLTTLVFEVTDVNGNKDSVSLSGIELTTKRWKIDTALFDQVDITKIRTLAFVASGIQANKKINIDWGQFFFIPNILSDASLNAANITKLPLNSTGDRVNLTGFAGTVDANDSANVLTTSITQASMTFNLFQPNSFGGAFVDYDDLSTNDGNPATTTDIESINLNTLFPNGIVLGLVSPDSSLGSVKLEVTDVNGNKDTVMLSGITNVEKYWKIPVANYDQVDVTKIKTVAFVVEGINNGSKLNVNWGDFQHTPGFTPGVNTTVTLVPLNSQSERPVLTGFASYDASTDPFSNTAVNMTSRKTAELTFNHFTSSSFGGVFFDYDDFNTGSVETINLSTAFGSQIVFGMSSPDSSVSDIVLEVTDINGSKDSVLLSGITNTEQFWNIDITAFDQVDRTKIKSIAFVKSGIQNGTKLNLNWGEFFYRPVVSGAAFNDSQITTLPVTPAFFPGGGNADPLGTDGEMNYSQLGDQEFEMEYDISNGDGSFAFLALRSPVNATYTLPEDFVIAARGRQGAQVRVEILDNNGLRADFILNLTTVYQNYTLTLSGDNVPVGFDRTNILSVTYSVDRSLTGAFPNDLVQVQMKGLPAYIPSILPTELQQVKDDLISKGLDYFDSGVGVDPATHLPYDNISDTGTAEKFTQPTLIGFYSQILGEVVQGNLNNGMTTDQALTEISDMMTSLLNVQTNHGWNGLLPWLNLDGGVSPKGSDVGLGDNANLAQSLAVMIGSLESATLTAAQQTARDAIIAQVDTFLDNQEAGYLAFVNTTFNLFNASVDTNTGFFSFFIDRLAQEFRGAIAFLLVRYPSLPSSVWNNLPAVFGNYTENGGEVINNLLPYDGGAFQIFWPLLRNNEQDFIGFRNMQYNFLVSEADYASQNNLPGFVSASQTPQDVYIGRQGVAQLAEDASGLQVDLGSTYAIASAASIDPVSMLDWLNKIKSLADINGTFGLLDAARSNTEIAPKFIGVDVASTVLGLSGQGADAFATYLKNRNLEQAYNLLYESKSAELVSNISKANASIAAPSELANRSLSVFENFSSETSLNGFPVSVTQTSGVRLVYGSIAGETGKLWDLNQPYDAQANKLSLIYSTVDSPKEVIISLRDASNTEIFRTTKTLTDGNFQNLIIDIPNEVSLQNVDKVALLIDQAASGDNSGDFTVHVIDFKHFPSSQNISPDAALGSGDVSTLPGSPAAEFNGSGPSSITRDSAPVTTLNFDVSNPADSAGILINFDPLNNGAVGNFTGYTSFVFGINSDKAKTVKVEIEDADGYKATFYATGVDTSRQYYQFIDQLGSVGVDPTRIKKITLSVDSTLLGSGNEIGSLQLEVNGLQFP